MADARSVLLIHGGLWEDTGADWFWRRTGVVDGLQQRGLTVLAPDRLPRATSWLAEARHLAAAAGGPDAAAAAEPHPAGSAGQRPRRQALTVVAGSFGCAAAVRLALDYPGLAGRLLLAWPASPEDQVTVMRVRAALGSLGASDEALGALLGGGTLPGAADAELTRLNIPVGIVPAAPPDPLHPRSAVDALLRLLPAAAELPGGTPARVCRQPGSVPRRGHCLLPGIANPLPRGGVRGTGAAPSRRPGRGSHHCPGATEGHQPAVGAVSAPGLSSADEIF